jgi:rhodanese-related sulfurtransferase
VLALLRALQQVGEERLLEVRELVEIYINSRDTLEPVPLEKLRERAARGEVIVLDVRPEEEYRAGHLPEAHSIPVEQLNERIHELPAGKEVIAYCRGPYCLLSVSAVEQLREKGFNAVRLEEGFPEWKANNLPYETAQAPST